jgi:uncharacterized protein (TIGR03118 family)
MNPNHTRPGALAALGLIGLAAFAAGQSRQDVTLAAHDQGNDYVVTILVSNETDETPVVDPLLVNAWGIAASDTGPWWVADNGSGYSTVYKGDGTKLPLEVKVPGAPTGTVHNGSTQFQMAADTPATFLFASEDGTFSAWNSTIDPNAVVVFSSPTSNYKGLALHGDVLYSTDFGECRVVSFKGNFFDGSFKEFDTAGGFQDQSIPQSFCPFGIRAAGDSIFVTYALKDGHDDVPGIGHGFVRQFDADGNLMARVGSHGLLNSPWGLAMAPQEFGRFGGCLIVGNFGDGRLNAFCENPAGQWHFAGRLRHRQHAVTVDGLWCIGFGNDGAAGPHDVLYFAAGPDGESNGYYGKIEAVVH